MARHVRTAAGARFFGKPIGSLISEGEYQSVIAAKSRKGNEAPALPKLQAGDYVRHPFGRGGKSTSRVASADETHVTVTNRGKKTQHPLGAVTFDQPAEHSNAAAIPSGGNDHAKLLEDRRQARAQYPVGHPERLKAERAVRQSRKSDEYRGAKTPGSSAEPETTKSNAPTYSPSEQHYSGGLPKDERDVYDAARRNGKDHAEAVKQVVRYRGGNPRFSDSATRMRESAAARQAPQGHGPAPDSKEAIISHLAKEHGVSESMLRRGGGEGGSSRSLKSLQASWAEWHREHPAPQPEHAHGQHSMAREYEQQIAAKREAEHNGGQGSDFQPRKPEPKPVKQSTLISPEDIEHSTPSLHTVTTGPKNLKEVRRGVQTRTSKEIRSQLTHQGKHVGLVSTAPGGGGELEIGNRSQYLSGSYRPGGRIATTASEAHSGNVSQAKDYAAGEINARRVRAALTASGHVAARKSSTRVKGWYDYFAGHEVRGGKGGVSIEHQLSSGAMRQGEESAKKRSDALQKYMSTLAARGIIAIPQRDTNGNIVSLHVPHPKKGG